jgi:deoxyribonuclease-4
MSIAGGVDLALQRGRSIHCNAVQLFVQNRNQWKARPLRRGEVAAFRAGIGDFAPGFIIAHSIYLINLASPDVAIRKKSIRGFLVEMRRAERLRIPYIVLHPGSHRGAGERWGVETIIENLNHVLEKTAGDEISVLLETTAGQGNSIGHTFEQLASIVSGIELQGRIGICFDTCHAFAAGYDIRSKKAYRETFRRFDDLIGLDRLRAFHLNDSLKELGSRVDRHTHIGKGHLGVAAFRNLVNDERFFDRPMILETPKGPDMEEDIQNLKILRSLRKSKKSPHIRRRGDK